MTLKIDHIYDRFMKL